MISLTSSIIAQQPTFAVPAAPAMRGAGGAAIADRAAETAFRIPAPIQHVAPLDTSAMPVGPTNFGHLMQSVVGDVNEKQLVAGEKLRDMLAGGKTQLHEVVVAMEESRVSFRVLSEARNKFLEAYQEVMRMQI